MHEKAVIENVTRKDEETAAELGAERVTRVVVQLGALSHCTPEHFREHFDEAARGTIAEGAEVVATLESDVAAPFASDMLLTDVELEFPDRKQAEL